MKIKELSESFNESLLDPECAEQPSINNDAPEDEDDPNQPFTISSNRDYSYYRSEEWQEYVETELSEIEISQPSIPHKPAQQGAAELNSPAQPFKQSQCSFCKERGHNKRKCRLLQLKNVELLPQDKTPIPSAVGIPVPQVSNFQVRPLAIGVVTIWNLPIHLSQSTINGRLWSNACTLISLLIAKSYYMNQALLELKPNQPLSGHWITIIVSGILGGNSVYDSSVPGGKLLGVLEAVPFVALSIGDVHISEELTVCFVREDDANDQSALSHQLRSYFDTNCDSAAFVILDGKTVTFLQRGNDVIVVDSHASAQQNTGAIIAKAPKGSLENLLVWVKGRISQTVNLCTVTFIKYFS